MIIAHNKEKTACHWRQPWLYDEQVYRPELINMWIDRRCFEHIETCFSSSHLTGTEVMVDASTHAESCTCWRHHISEYIYLEKMLQ